MTHFTYRISIIQRVVTTSNISPMKVALGSPHTSIEMWGVSDYTLQLRLIATMMSTYPIMTKEMVTSNTLPIGVLHGYPQ